MAIFPKRVFPKDAPQFYSEKGEHIKKTMEDFYITASAPNLDYWSEASIDARFEAGDQDVYFELHPEIPSAFRKQFSFNRIRRITNMISGFQSRNRNATIVVPVENGDQETADQYSKIMSHINRKQQVLETVSDAFNGAIISGMSLLQVWNDYRTDPVSGSLKVDNCAYNTFLIDPFFKRTDLSDCNNIWKRSYLTKNQVKSLMPDNKGEIESLSLMFADDKFGFMPETNDRNRKNLMSYDEFYYLDSRKQKLLIDTTTGETMEWRNETEVGEQELAEFLRLYPDLTVDDQMVQTVKLAILVNGSLMYDGENPLGIDRYPFIPVLGYFRPSLQSYSMRVQGVVRGLRDAQFLYNRRKAIEDDILSSQVNSGYIYKENALVNPDDVFMSGQGKGIALKTTAQMTDVVPIQPGQIPPSMLQFSEQYAKEIMEISGANEEMVGNEAKDISGFHSMLRTESGKVVLQPLFDNLDRAQKLLGSVMLEAIQANYTPGKVKRIIEEEPTEQFYNRAFGKYDAAIEAGFDTATQRQAEFAQLLHLKEIGIPIPDETIIEAATLQNKGKLTEAIQKSQEQAQQQQQKQEEFQQRLQEAQANLANAKVESDLSLAKERDSRVFSNIGLMEERQNESEKDKTQALLNLVKTMQEIDDIDLNQLSKLIQLSQVVGDAGNSKVEAIGSAINKGATKDVPNVPTQKSMMQNAPQQPSGSQPSGSQPMGSQGGPRDGSGPAGPGGQ